MDFYIFWKLRFCRTPPSTRQLFYPLVNLSLTSHLPIPFLSIHISSLHSPFPNPTFIQISPNTHPTPPISHFLLFLPSTYPQLIHNSHTSYPQLFHKLSTTLYLVNRPFFYPIIPTYITISPIIPITIPTISPSKVIHRYTELSTSYPQSSILIHRLSTDISNLSYV